MDGAPGSIGRAQGWSLPELYPNSFFQPHDRVRPLALLMQGRDPIDRVRPLAPFMGEGSHPHLLM
ncbi:MAG: hypothetical protein JO011_18825 [Ktedonobacteraceae bacterium]|nr:hypothetical protein [Ktedonobacteraceae bacterium]